MSIFQRLIERLRPELPVKPEILEREERMNESSPLRESWVLDHVYLCEGDLEALKKHPDFEAGRRVPYVMAYYDAPQGKKGPCRRVSVNVQLGLEGMDERDTRCMLERALKLDLHSRGCNAGIFYRTYKKGKSLYAEAVPAVLTRE
jgi:hypothetical protein